MPNIVISDSEEKKPAPAAEANKQAQVPSPVEQAEGAEPAKPAYVIPDWYTVGWRQMSGIDNPPLPAGEEKDLSILDTFLQEQWYASWYHDAGVLVFVGPCIFSAKRAY